MATQPSFRKIQPRQGSNGSIFDFDARIQEFADAIGVACDELTRQTVLACFRGVREETPVDTGFHRANWQIEAGSMNRGAIPLNSPPTAQEMKIMTHPSPSGRVWWIFNNGPAIKRLEYGWSKKKPNGMVRVTIANVLGRLEQIKRAAVRAAGLGR